MQRCRTAQRAEKLWSMWIEPDGVVRPVLNEARGRRTTYRSISLDTLKTRGRRLFANPALIG